MHTARPRVAVQSSSAFLLATLHVVRTSSSRIHRNHLCSLASASASTNRPFELCCSRSPPRPAARSRLVRTPAIGRAFHSQLATRAADMLVVAAVLCVLLLQCVAMVSLKLQKRLASSVLKCGKRKVWLDPNEVNEIHNANSRQQQHHQHTTFTHTQRCTRNHQRARGTERERERKMRTVSATCRGGPC